MNNNKQANEHFETLLARLLDNTLQDEQYQELIAMAEHNEALKAQLKDQLSIDHLLYQNAESPLNLTDFVNSTLELAAKQQKENHFEKNIINAISNNKNKALPANQRNKQAKTFKHYYLPWLMSGLSMAACALFFIQSLQKQAVQSPLQIVQEPILEYQDTGVAVIANALSLGKNAPFKIGDTVKPGVLTLSTGFLELEFYRGAQLKIVGPATINIINQEHIQLLSGKVMTDVPKVAIGFTIDTPNSEIIDLGTEIGVEVLANGQSKVHVFEGLVEARNKHGYRQLIEKGQAVNFSGETKSSWLNSSTLASEFSVFEQIAGLTGTAINLQHKKWLRLKAKVLQNPDLVTYYDFEPNAKNPRILNNLSKYGAEHHGAIVGAKWSDGPWQGKRALDFKRASDRVRIELDNKMASFTLATWVQIDSLDRSLNSILLTDGYKPGDIHWQISKVNSLGFGKIVLGLQSLTKGAKDYRYSPFFSPAESGTWYHLAIRLNHQNNMLSMFVNGENVKQSKIKNPSEYWQIGSASIGNWDNTLFSKPLRNLNGSIAEMMIFNAALPDDYIKSIALAD